MTKATDREFFTNTLQMWDPEVYQRYVYIKNHPEPSVGTMERGPFKEGLGRFVPNDLGKAAIDKAKQQYGVDVNIKYMPSDDPGELAHYSGIDPRDAPNVRNMYSSQDITLPTFAHELGHALDPNLDKEWADTRAYWQTPGSIQRLNKATPAGQLQTFWSHSFDEKLNTAPGGNKQNIGKSATIAETEAQRFAQKYLDEMAPNVGVEFKNNPWTQGYPASYGDYTIDAVYAPRLNGGGFFSPGSEQPGTIGSQGPLGSDVVYDPTDANAYAALKLGLDKKFQDTSDKVLKEARDYPRRILQ